MLYEVQERLATLTLNRPELIFTGETIDAAEAMCAGISQVLGETESFKVELHKPPARRNV